MKKTGSTKAISAPSGKDKDIKPIALPYS